MRTTRITLSALLLAGALSVAAAAQPPAPALVQPALNAAIGVGVGFHGTVSVDFFYSNLAPYGLAGFGRQWEHTPAWFFDFGAGAEYRLGREARSETNELYAGVVYMDYETRAFLPGLCGLTKN